MTASVSRYAEIHAQSIQDPERFWREAARAIDWFEEPARAFDPAQGIYGRWFPGGVTNVCHNAVDRHVTAGRGDQPAIFYDSPVAGAKRTVTYGELQTEVSALAGVLRNLGVGKGDRVVIYLSLIHI